MAKQETLPKKELTRRQLARREKEKQLTRILIWSAIGVVTLIALILGYGLVSEFVLKPRKPVAKVDGVAINTQEFQNRQYYERLLMRNQLDMYQYYLSTLDPNDQSAQSLYQQVQMWTSNLETQLSETMASAVGKQVLDTMVEERLVQNEAQSRNLTVSDDDVALRIEEIVGYDRQAAETVTDTTTITSFDSLYQSFKDKFLKESNLSEEAFRAMVKADLLKGQLKTIIGADVQQTADQIEATLFITTTEEAARVIQERLNNGEDPAALVEELNNDPDNLTLGYAMGWVPPGYISTQWGPAIEQVAFNTPVGRASEPTIGNEGRYYVIYVSGHEERPLDESLLQQGREQKYEEWLTQQKEARCEYLDWEKAVLTAP